MNFENTSFELACIIDVMKAIDKKKTTYLEKIGAVLSPDYLRTYSAVYQETERVKLNKSYLSDMMEDVSVIEQECKKLQEAFEKDISAKSNTLESVNICLNYISVSGSDFDSDYIETIGKPLKLANDIRSMKAIHNICEKLCAEKGKLPFDGIMTECFIIDELKRKIDLLCKKAVEQLPNKDVDIEALSCTGAVLDEWGVVNLINYAKEIKSEIDGTVYTPNGGGSFNFDFKSVRDRG